MYIPVNKAVMLVLKSLACNQFFSMSMKQNVPAPTTISLFGCDMHSNEK